MESFKEAPAWAVHGFRDTNDGTTIWVDADWMVMKTVTAAGVGEVIQNFGDEPVFTPGANHEVILKPWSPADNTLPTRDLTDEQLGKMVRASRALGASVTLAGGDVVSDPRWVDDIVYKVVRDV